MFLSWLVHGGCADVVASVVVVPVDVSDIVDAVVADVAVLVVVVVKMAVVDVVADATYVVVDAVVATGRCCKCFFRG